MWWSKKKRDVDATTAEVEESNRQDRPKVDSLPLEHIVQRQLQRSTCTAATVDVIIDPTTVSSFDSSRAAATTRTVTKQLWNVAEGDGARVTIIGANGLLGQAVLKACRGNPMVQHVTAVVRDVDKAERELRPMFDASAEEAEQKKRGYIQIKKTATQERDGTPDVDRSVKRNPLELQTLDIVEGDVRRRNRANAGKLPDDAPLQAAIANSDIVVACAAGKWEKDNGPLQVDYLGNIRMAALAAACDARFVGFTAMKCWAHFHWYHSLVQTYPYRPWFYTSHRGFERILLDDTGMKLFPPLNSVNICWSLAFIDPPNASFRDSLSFCSQRGQGFPEWFRCSIFRLGPLLPTRMTSNFEFGYNDNRLSVFRRGAEPISSLLAGSIVMRSLLTQKGQIHHRVDLSGRPSKEIVHMDRGAATQVSVDAALSRPPTSIPVFYEDAPTEV